MLNFIDIKERLKNEHISFLLSFAIGDITRIDNIIANYLDDPHSYCIGINLDNEIIGLIGIKILGKSGIIKHIAIAPEYRGMNYGRKLVKHVISKWKLIDIFAETDDDAVEFYKKLKFDIVLYQGEYNIRYKCHLKVKYD